jgi:hypothetical protein
MGKQAASRMYGRRPSQHADEKPTPQAASRCTASESAKSRYMASTSDYEPQPGRPEGHLGKRS